MKLKSFLIKGFRRISETTVYFSDATFLIGENNVGKSSVLKALELFFSANKADINDFMVVDEQGMIRYPKIELTAEFSGLPEDADNWRGFKGRVIKEKKHGVTERKIFYRKTYLTTGVVEYEMKEYNRNFKNEFDECKTVKDLIDAGLDKTILSEIDGFTEDLKLAVKAGKDFLNNVDEVWEVIEENDSWVRNPGGIPGNILIRLPRFLLIPADDKKNEISQTNGALQKTMYELFDEVRDSSDNYKKAQEYLDLLALELDPKDTSQEFGQMMVDVNKTLKNVFPESRLHVTTTLKDPDKSIVPIFEVQMSSNIKTTAERQGLGSVRSAVFALLHYRELYLERKREKSKDDEFYTRTLIIGFEEPEIYLHPNVANNMRDEIYNLAISSSSQLVCTTHSPYMMDLGKDLDKTTYPKQILNLFKFKRIVEIPYRVCYSIPINITDAFQTLIDDQRDSIKFILKMDDYVSRVFFAKSIIIIEGDTEDIVFRETINRMPEELKREINTNYQIIKARGKPAIIALVNYLKALSLDPFVIHDEDRIEGATKFNEPIKETLGSENKRYMFKFCIEDILGYSDPGSDKPFKAYMYIKNSWIEDQGWKGVQDNWCELCESIFFKEVFDNYKHQKICQLLELITKRKELK